MLLTKNDLLAIKKLMRDEVRGAQEKLTTEMHIVEKKLTARIEKVQETVDIVQDVMVKHHTQLEQRVANIEGELHGSRN